MKSNLELMIAIFWAFRKGIGPSGDAATRSLSERSGHSASRAYKTRRCSALSKTRQHAARRGRQRPVPPAMGGHQPQGPPQTGPQRDPLVRLPGRGGPQHPPARQGHPRTSLAAGLFWHRQNTLFGTEVE